MLFRSVYFHVNQSRQTLLAFKDAAGLWRHDRWKPIIAGAANLAMNVSMVLLLPEEYKLDGVILSTIVSYVAIQVPWERHVVFTEFFGRAEARRYRRQQAAFALLACALAAAAWAAASAVPLGGFPGLFAKAAAAGAVATAPVLLFFRRDLASALARKSGK